MRSPGVPIRFPLLLLLPLAFWPVVRWYALRAADGADEPWQLIALGALLWSVWNLRTGLSRCDFDRTASALGLGLYLLSYPFLPPIGRAGIAIGTIAAALVPIRSAPPGTAALVVLALPIFSTLDFFLSSPLRRVTAFLSLPLLHASGFMAEVSGNSFLWDGKPILIDAPCSGIRMLYSSSLLAAILATALRLPLCAVFRLFALTGLLILSGNVLRSTALFLLESRPFFPELMLEYEAPLHTGIGLVVAIAVAAGIALLALHENAAARPDENSARSSSPPRTGIDRWLCLLLVGAAAMPLFCGRTAARAIDLDSTALPELAGTLIRDAGLSELHAPDRSAFRAAFPGVIRRFRNTHTELLIRSVAEPTRALHPSADCFRGAGFQVTPAPSTVRGAKLWSCFQAAKDGQRLQVCEHITAPDGTGWPDVSEWYWGSLLGNRAGPFSALTYVQAADDPSRSRQ